MTEESYGHLPDAFFLPERVENPDEIVLEDVKLFHLENMVPDEHLWIACYTQDNKIYHLNIFAKDNKLTYYWSKEQ